MKKILTLIIVLIVFRLFSEEVSDKEILRFAKKMGIKTELIINNDKEKRYCEFVQNDKRKFFLITSDFHQEIGYQGNTTLGLIIDQDLKIERVRILKSEDTRSFIKKLKRKSYLNQFLGNPTKNEIKYVSGATLSSNAVKKIILETFSDFIKII